MQLEGRSGRFCGVVDQISAKKFGEFFGLIEPHAQAAGFARVQSAQTSEGSEKVFGIFKGYALPGIRYGYFNQVLV